MNLRIQINIKAKRFNGEIINFLRLKIMIICTDRGGIWVYMYMYEKKFVQNQIVKKCF